MRIANCEMRDDKWKMMGVGEVGGEMREERGMKMQSSETCALMRTLSQRQQQRPELVETTTIYFPSPFKALRVAFRSVCCCL